MTDIKAPTFPESIADGEVATWHYQVGDSVRRDEVLVEIETDKVVLEVVAPADGKLTEILKEEGDTVLAEEVLAHFEEGKAEETDKDDDGGKEEKGGKEEEAGKEKGKKEGSDDGDEDVERKKEADKGKEKEKARDKAEDSEEDDEDASADQDGVVASPAARKIAEENKLNLKDVKGTGKGDRVTKEDVLRAIAEMETQPPPTKVGSDDKQAEEEAEPIPEGAMPESERVERRVPMSRLRSSIARRLVDAQHTAAMLTTFNEVDMQAIMDLRNKYKDQFEKVHDGVRLGFMSFFVRASIEALKRFPAVNASIDENDIVYHGYQDIGVAVGSPRGLVVPVLRDADGLTLAEIEDQIRDYSIKARDGKLTIDEMTGGTFTISNGGVFGSLLSTPILNPPQTAILGMHKIQERPMAIDGKVEIRPMMYLALTYDHRLIDGQEAVRFLVTIKEFLEEPARILLDL